MFLLAVITGARRIAEPFVEALIVRDRFEPLSGFIQDLDARDEFSREPEWRRLKLVLESHGVGGEGTLSDVLQLHSSGSLGSLIDAVPLAVRFSFRIGRLERKLSPQTLKSDPGSTNQ